MAKLSLDDRLNQIEDKISEKSFRENKGRGNEVGYYIFDYDPREELYVRNHIAYPVSYTHLTLPTTSRV